MQFSGGQLTQTADNPVFPGATSTGPLIAGNVIGSDGTGNLAGVGETVGTANQGSAVLCQWANINQTAAGTGSGQVTQIVLPAQSMIVHAFMFVTTAWSGSSTTFSVVDTQGSPANYAVNAAGGTLGQIALNPGTTKATIQNWENVGNTDRQLVVTSGNTGNGLGILYIRYVQGANATKSA
jgi:hypothetical protein